MLPLVLLLVLPLVLPLMLLLVLQLVLPLEVSIVAIEVPVMVLPLALQPEVGLLPFPLALSLEEDVIVLTEFLAGARKITEPDLVVVALLVGEVGEFPQT